VTHDLYHTQETGECTPPLKSKSTMQGTRCYGRVSDQEYQMIGNSDNRDSSGFKVTDPTNETP